MNLTKQQPTVVHSTFVIEREYPVAPERVYAAFADAAIKRRWYADRGSQSIDEFEMDFRVGGVERFHYRLSGGPVAGKMLSHEGTFHDIVPNRRIVFASTMSLENYRMSTTLITFEILPHGSGSTLVLTHQGAFFEGSDGPERREGGWQDLMKRLDAELAR